MGWTGIHIFPLSWRSKIESSENLKRILPNTGWLFADRVIRMGAGLLVGVWLARYLGPEQYGLYSYAVAFVALFGTLATLGLDGIVVRDLVRDPLRQGETLGTAFILKFIGGLATLSITIGAISLMSPNDSSTCWLVAIIGAGTVFQSFDAIDFWFQSQVLSKYTIYAKNSAFILMALCKLLLIWLQAPLIAFAWAAFGEIILAAAGLLIVYRITGQSFRTWRSSFLRAEELLSDSWPLIFAGMAVMVYLRIDVIMLKEMVGDKAVGVYSAATRISEIWYFIPVAIASSISPAIIEAKKINDPIYYQRLQRAFNVAARLAYLVIIPMTFLSTPIVMFLYGPTFAAAGPVLAIHIWAGIFVFLGVIRNIWIIAEGYTKLTMVTTFGGAVVNVVLNLYLLPRYAEMGAAIATVVAYSFSDYFIFMIYPRFRNIGWAMTSALTLNLFEKTDL